MVLRTMVLVPTRERPGNAARLYKHLSRSDFDFRFCIDTNDPKVHEYAWQIPSNKIMYGKPARLGPWLNRAAFYYDGIYDMIGFMGDDVIPRTVDWDELIAEAYRPDCIIYPNDGLQGANLPTSVFMDTHIIRELGYMVYPELTHLYIDNHWKALGEALGTLTYLPDVHLEHMHYLNGKAEEDEVYQRSNHPDMYSRDGKAFMEFLKVLPNETRKFK